MKSKIILLVFCGLMIWMPAHSQLGYIPSTAHRYSFGFGVGITDLFADLHDSYIKEAAISNFDYNITPYIGIGAELEYGLLSTGGLTPHYGLGDFTVNNTFIAYNINARLGLGQFLRKVPKSGFMRFIKGLYVGGGAGYVNSNIKLAVRISPPAGDLQDFKYKSTDIVYVLNDGIIWDLPKFFGLYDIGFRLNLQTNLPQGYGVDGDYGPLSHFRKAQDFYTIYSASLRINFGPLR